MKGRIYERLDRLDEAALEYRTAVTSDPQELTHATNYANALDRLGRLDEAETLLRNVLADHSDFASGHVTFGRILRRQRRYGDAEAEFRAAMALRPKYANASFNLSRVLIDQGHFGEAIAATRQAADWDTTFQRWVDGTQELVDLDNQLTTVLSGEAAIGDSNRIAIAQFAWHSKRRYLLAFGILRSASPSGPRAISDVLDSAKGIARELAARSASVAQSEPGQERDDPQQERNKAAEAYLARVFEDLAAEAISAGNNEEMVALLDQCRADLAAANESATERIAKMRPGSEFRWDELWREVHELTSATHDE